MTNWTLIALMGSEVLFVGTGVLLLVVSLVFKNVSPESPGSFDEATTILLQMTPLTGEFFDD